MAKIKEKIRRLGKKETLEKALKDEIIAGALIGIVNNVLHGRAFIDTNAVMQKATRMDLTNPLIFIVLGKILKVPALSAIGAFRLVNPAQPTQTQEQTQTDTGTYYNVYLR